MLEGEKAELYNPHKWEITYFRKVNNTLDYNSLFTKTSR